MSVRGGITGKACQLVACWMTLRCARAVRGGWEVALADLLQLVPIIIPENGAPQLRPPKKSPSVQLGVVVMMSRWERLTPPPP